MITHPDSIRCGRPSAMCCVKYGKTLPPVSNINNLEVFLTCNEWTVHCCSWKCTSLMSECENTALQWAFRLDSAAVATAETWHLKGHTLKSNNDLPEFYHTTLWTLKDSMKWMELKFKFLDYVNSRSILHLSFKQHCTDGLKEQTSSFAWETFLLKKAWVNTGVKGFRITMN